MPEGVDDAVVRHVLFDKTVVSDNTGRREVRFAQAARKHKIGKAAVWQALGRAGVPRVLSNERLLWIGADDDGVELEIIGGARAPRSERSSHHSCDADGVSKGRLLVMTTDPAQYAFSEKWVIGPDIDLDEEVFLNPDGTRFTEADAEAFTMQRYHEATAQAKRGGRPSLGERGTSPVISFRLPPELREIAVEVAAAEGRTVSAMARDLLRNYVRDHAPVEQARDAR